MNIPILPSQRRMVLPSTIMKVNYTWPVVYGKKDHDWANSDGKILDTPHIVIQAQCLRSSLCSSLCSLGVTHPNRCRQSQPGSLKGKYLCRRINTACLGSSTINLTSSHWNYTGEIQIQIRAKSKRMNKAPLSTSIRIRPTSVSHRLKNISSGALPISSHPENRSYS